MHAAPTILEHLLASVCASPLPATTATNRCAQEMEREAAILLDVFRHVLKHGFFKPQQS
jgi:hypothetical protein